MDVAVLDKRDVASGSTSASTAMLQYEIDTMLTFGETKDGLAYIGPVPDFSRSVSGGGITYSVIAAEIVRDTIQGRQYPDARLFRFDR